MATATLKVNADITELMAELDNIKKQLGGLKEQNKELNNAIDKGFKDNSNAVNQYTNNLENAERELKRQKQIIAEMKAAENQLKVARRQSNDPKEIAKYDKELKRLAQDLAIAKKEQVQLNSTYEKSKQKLKENTKALKEKNKEGGNAQKIFKKLGGILAAAFSVAAITSFIKKSIELYDIQAKAEAKLLTALKGRKDIYNQLTIQATNLQQKTLYGDEEIINAQAMLAKTLGSNGKAIQELTPLVLDLAAAQGLDLNSAADLVAKSVGSSTNALKRYGIEIEGTKGSSERLQSAIIGLNKQVGGQSVAASKAGTSSFKKLKNAWKDLQESVGASTTGMNYFLDSIRELIQINESDVMEKQRQEMFLLQAEINSTNTSQEDRIKLINELKQIYPAYLGNIDADTIKNEELNAAILDVNNSLIDKIILQKENEKVTSAGNKAADAKKKLLDIERSITMQYVKLTKEVGEETKNNLSYEEKLAKIREISLRQSSSSMKGYTLQAIGQYEAIYRKAKMLAEQTDEDYKKSLTTRQEIADQLDLSLDGRNKKEIEYNKLQDELRDKATNFLNINKLNEKNANKFYETIKKNSKFEIFSYKQILDLLTEINDLKEQGEDDEPKNTATAYEELTKQLQELNKEYENQLFLNSPLAFATAQRIKDIEKEIETIKTLAKGLKNFTFEEDVIIEPDILINPKDFEVKKDAGIELSEKMIKSILGEPPDAEDIFTPTWQMEFATSLNEIFGGTLFKNLDHFERFVEGMKGLLSLGLSEVSDFMSIEVEQWSNVLSNVQKQINETEQKLEEEQQKQKEGLANNVKLEQQRLDMLADKQKEAEAMQQKALKRQRAVDSITQSINIATAISGILKDLGSKGIIGLVLAPALIAGLLILFKNSKQKAADAAKYEQGGYGVLGGKRHSDGGTYVPYIGEVEQGEFFGIINRKQTQKYQSGLAPLIDGINSNDNRKLIRGLNEIALRANLKSMQGGGVNKVDINSKVSLNEISDIKKIRELMENGVSVTYTDGYRIEKKGNITKRIKMN